MRWLVIKKYSDDDDVVIKCFDTIQSAFDYMKEDWLSELDDLPIAEYATLGREKTYIINGIEKIVWLIKSIEI